MKKECFVNAIIERPFIEEKVEVVPREEIFSGVKEDLQEAVLEVTQKVEIRLKKLGFWGHLYVAFKTQEALRKEMGEILNQLGWREIISYAHKKCKEGEEKRENGWIKKVS